MSDVEHLLVRAARAAAEHRRTVGERPITPRRSAEDVRAAFAGPLPEAPTDPDSVLTELLMAADGAITGSVGPRFFGFVIGGALPAASAAEILATGWDQAAYNEALSLAAGAAERAAGAWTKDLLGLPTESSTAFVTGAQAGNTVGLAIGRNELLARAGWDVAHDGLYGAPPVRVVASEERHATVDRALRLLGMGTTSVHPVRAGHDGAIDVDHLGEVLAQNADAPTIVCLQAGNVNTGACDDFDRAVPLARHHDAWVHVDGAFGLWAGASPRHRHLTRGVELADSWGTDAHKWLNVPYDSGLAICRDASAHAAAMSYSAAYLTGSGGTDHVLGDVTPESSRRARGFAVWAALRELGRSGVADLVDRSCAHAQRMAELLTAGGATVYNEVVLNQVLVGFGDLSSTDAVVDAVQRDGTCWVGATTWRGRRLIRISVSNWTTTESDIELSADAILRAAT
ncbi:MULTISPECIES: pyridoxal phosphate-dependent decarboxylase family protein [Nocardioides]|uniref:Pyridoxal phosphate-dependent decarboxylase family protein n=1 Tax=Nocardioides vastitatis TaxID=2568655 RepID=A0ABW0ZBF6_9ACTN|nr:aminotransferase class V-fold PLP-dependent enzyme [Nocardioides sp.]THI96181.1 aspartate aminotransferase family protein [Nocardioides sp.]